MSTDIAPPTTHALRRLFDPRASQLWDRELSLSRVMRGDDDEVVWDYVAAYPADVLWGDDLPKPAFQSSPVVSAIEELRRWLSMQTQVRTDAGPASRRRSPA